MEVAFSPRLRTEKPGQEPAQTLPVVEHVPVVSSDQRVQHHGLRLAAGLHLHPLPFRQPFGANDSSIGLRDDGDAPRNPSFPLSNHFDSCPPTLPPPPGGTRPAFPLSRYLHPPDRVIIQL